MIISSYTPPFYSKARGGAGVVVEMRGGERQRLRGDHGRAACCVARSSAARAASIARSILPSSAARAPARAADSSRAAARAAAARADWRRQRARRAPPRATPRAPPRAPPPPPRGVQPRRRVAAAASAQRRDDRHALCRALRLHVAHVLEQSVSGFLLRELLREPLAKRVQPPRRRAAVRAPQARRRRR